MKSSLNIALVAVAAILLSQPAPEKKQAGPLPGGGFLLPDGWQVQPAGKQIPLDTFPMSSALSKDGKYLLVLNGGYNPPSIIVLRTDTMQEVGRTPVADAWLGLTFSQDGKLVYVGGGSQASVFEFSFNDGKLQPSRNFAIVPEKERTDRDFIGDVAVSADGRLVYAAGLLQNTIFVINPQSGRVIEKHPTGRRPYRILFHPDGQSYVVSSWVDGSVYHHNALTGERLGVVRLGQHPTDMIWRARKEGETEEEQKAWSHRLFVTAGNTNSVYVVGSSESKELRMIEVVNLAMYPRQPLGMTPSALALSADQNRLYVACSDANALIVADVSFAKSSILGAVPTGWYPTAVRALPDNRIVVLNGRGSRSFPNSDGKKHVAQLQVGTASLIDPFDDQQLDKYSAMTIRNSPYRDDFLDGIMVPQGSPIPARPGEPSPIQHVIYIVKGHQSYDQVLGDLGKGNGDPKLAAFGEKVTPNHHKLAREFVVLDNFYANGDVDADGMNWSAAAIAPDFVQKMWPNSYGGRGRQAMFGGGEPAAVPPAGYLWTNAGAAGISMRNYGWLVNNSPKAVEGQQQIVSVRDSTLTKHTSIYYRGSDPDYSDVRRAQIFVKELQEFQGTGQLPKLIMLRLGNPPAQGTTPEKSAEAVADNDAALGMIVEAVSKSKFWPQAAIFVAESSAPQSADHVDSHRVPAFIISPYARRSAVDNTMYNTASMLRTVELIIGLRPMTHFDAAARPMASAFEMKPDPRPYEAAAR